MVCILNLYENLLEGLLERRWLGPTPPHPEVSDSAGLEWGSGVCISNKLPGQVVAVGPGDHTLRTNA